MKHDNQWKPSERHSKGYAPYQRHKLKAANWVTPEEAAVISKRSNNWRNWDNGIWRREPDWKLEKELINKYIGKPYDMFIKAWHERTKSLRKQGVPLKPKYINHVPTDKPDTYWDEFYVDFEGIIRKNPDYGKHWCRRQKKPIKVIEKEVIKYNLKSDIHSKNWCTSTPFYMILSILRRYFSTTDYNDILAGGIPKDKFDRMVESSWHSGINFAIDRFAHKHNARLIEVNNHAYRGIKNWCHYDCFKDLFDADYSESVYRYIYPGTPEYSQITAEQNDASKKARREYKHQKEEIAANLLHNIESDRKAREADLNRQKIIKHGFDENESFRGEEYHGKKHKRRKMAIEV